MSTTTRLVTLGPPEGALDGVLDALHAAAERPGTATTVGRADRMPKVPGQPDSAYTVVELFTAGADDAPHDEFIAAAGESLKACGVPYAWQRDGAPWQEFPG